MKNPGLVLLACMLLPVSEVAVAKSPPEAPRITVNGAATMGTLLGNLKGKRIDLHLKSGKTVRGTVGDVGSHVVQIQKISGKDYYDAYIAIKHVSGIDVQMRFPPGSF